MSSCGGIPPTTDKSAGTTADKTLQTLYIAAQQADCVGVGPQKCLQIRSSTADQWEYLYQSIRGFDYQEGYEYKVQVRVTERDNPPADASSLLYTLVKVLSKEKANPNSDLQKVVYEAYTRGSFMRVEVEQGQVNVFDARQDPSPDTKAMTSSAWQKITAAVDAVELAGISTLTPPSNRRASDGALAAQITITNSKGDFVSPIFDHKNPPEALKTLTDQVLSLAEEVD